MRLPGATAILITNKLETMKLKFNHSIMKPLLTCGLLLTLAPLLLSGCKSGKCHSCAKTVLRECIEEREMEAQPMLFRPAFAA